MIWNEIELFGIKIDDKKCSRSVPIENVPPHGNENEMTRTYELDGSIPRFGNDLPSGVINQTWQ